MQNFKHMICLCQRFGECRCRDVFKAKRLWLENILDTCQTIAEVMQLCCMKATTILLTKKILINCFKYFDEETVRVDLPRKKIMRKKEFFLRVGKTGRISCFESHLLYAIVKRVFRAFYFLTSQYGLPDYAAIKRSFHNPECAWIHAAMRTATIYAKYKGLFKTSKDLLENKILCLYKNLYERIQAKIKAFDQKLPKQKLEEVPKTSELEDFLDDGCICEEESSDHCDCPKFNCTICKDLTETEEDGQDGFICRWHTQYDPEPCFKVEEKQSTSCGSCEECVCDICECIPCEDEAALEYEEEGYVEEDDCGNLRKFLKPPVGYDNIYADEAKGRKSDGSVAAKDKSSDEDGDNDNRSDSGVGGVGGDSDVHVDVDDQGKRRSKAQEGLVSSGPGDSPGGTPGSGRSVGPGDIRRGDPGDIRRSGPGDIRRNGPGNIRRGGPGDVHGDFDVDNDYNYDDRVQVKKRIEKTMDKRKILEVREDRVDKEDRVDRVDRTIADKIDLLKKKNLKENDKGNTKTDKIIRGHSLVELKKPKLPNKPKKSAQKSGEKPKKNLPCCKKCIPKPKTTKNKRQTPLKPPLCIDKDLEFPNFTKYST